MNKYMYSTRYFYKDVIATLMLVMLLAVSCTFAYGVKNDKKDDNTINYKVTVIDSAQNAPMELVNLVMKRGDQVMHVNLTNHFGVAIFHDIEQGKYELVSNFIGYRELSVPVLVDPTHNSIKLLMQEKAIGLKEVVVSGTKGGQVSNYIDIRTGNKTFDVETYHAAPSTRMTTVIQQNLTGAVRAPTGEVHIRGQHGEFSYFIDGIPIPLGVFGGLNEVVDTKVIKDITFYTGGFPAWYGGQSAAIIDIQNRVPPGGFHLNLSTYAGSYLTSSNQNLGDKVGVFKA